MRNSLIIMVIAIFMLLPTALNAQKNDNIIRNWDDSNYENRLEWVWVINNDDFGSPLGSGLLVLVAGGAGYAMLKRRRNRKNGMMMLLALAMIFGMSGCKKKIVEPIVQPTGGDQVEITLNVGGGAKVNVNENHVIFEDGDVILVASNGRYVGALTKSTIESVSAFRGTITDPVEGQPLYFYFLGNKINVATLTAGASGSTNCTVNISDQTSELPVISIGPSINISNGAIVDYSSEVTSYSAQLHNKCSLMKFNVTTPSSAAICITGMNNTVTVDFSKAANGGENNGFSYSKEGEGVIKMKGGSGSPAVKWAIVLPQDASPAARAYTDDYAYVGIRPAMEAITANQYLESGFAMEVNTEFNPYTTPLTFEAKTAGATVTFTKAATIAELPIEYSLNGGAWNPYSSPINLPNSGDKVSFRGTNAAYSALGADYYSTISCTNDCYIYGNIMSLINSTNYANSETLSGNYAFKKLFYGNNHIVNHPSKTLVLPATTLTGYCYYQMFYGCTSLTNAPTLPAETLSPYCYGGMFYGCTSLTTAPALPAETLATYCYYEMFRGCTNLTTAPALPAKTLATYCYRGMFYGCTSLKAAPALPAETLATYCYFEMFRGCTSLTTAPALPAETLASTCYYSMFRDCTSLTTAPALPATTMKDNCYSNMFYGCTSLTTAPALPATTLVSSCYSQMFYGCTNLNRVICLATDISASNCTSSWLNGVAASGTFYKPSAMTSWTLNSPNGIPSGWTVVNLDLFSVSSTKQVIFSKGNLQATYNGSSWNWDFAPNQWDCIGNAAGNTSITGNGTVGANNVTVDLFGWSNGTTNHYGINNSIENGNYNGGFEDWGSLISDSYTWRTLTKDEWAYLIRTRSNTTVNGTSNARFVKAIINTDVKSVKGVIIFPDNYIGPTANNTNITWNNINVSADADFLTTCTCAGWASLEAVGCVFLPAGGFRTGASVNTNTSNDYGGYWSSTVVDTDKSYYFYFMNPGFNWMSEDNHHRGHSVRLVHELNL